MTDLVKLMDDAEHFRSLGEWEEAAQVSGLVTLLLEEHPSARLWNAEHRRANLYRLGFDELAEEMA